MRIVLAGALPPPALAAALIPPLQQAAPALLGWLDRSRASRIAADPATTLCTPWEAWLLQQCGFRPQAGQHLGAGLGPLLSASATPTTASERADAPVWLVALAHIAPSRDGALLIPARTPDITQAQSVALFDAARRSFEESGITATWRTPTLWQVGLPPGLAPASPSPELASRSALNDWWPQQNALRPWRRLFNELQMLWFDHPVNLARAQAGDAPVNGVWLFGGATRAQLARSADQALQDTHIEHGLAHHVQAQDWQGWLDAMAQLDKRYFTDARATPETVILTGADRILVLEPQRGWWARLRPSTTREWRDLWSSQD